MATRPPAKSPQLYAYLRRYQDDPTSRVFAPLSEAYRKAGMIREAIEIAREGLRLHPHFAPGKLALARALIDQNSYAEAAAVLGPLARDAPDSLIAQRLLAECCLMTAREPEALVAYKQILYFQPGDEEASRMVWELETRAYEGGAPLVKAEEPTARFHVVRATDAISNSPENRKIEWVRKVEFLQSMLLNLQRSRMVRPGFRD